MRTRDEIEARVAEWQQEECRHIHTLADAARRAEHGEAVKNEAARYGLETVRAQLRVLRPARRWNERRVREEIAANQSYVARTTPLYLAANEEQRARLGRGLMDAQAYIRALQWVLGVD